MDVIQLIFETPRMRMNRPIFAFTFLTSLSGVTELACLEIPVPTRCTFDYHLSSSGTFPVRRFGAGVAFEVDGGLVPGRKTLQAIRTGRKPTQLKEKRKSVRPCLIANQERA